MKTLKYSKDNYNKVIRDLKGLLATLHSYIFYDSVSDIIRKGKISSIKFIYNETIVFTLADGSARFDVSEIYTSYEECEKDVILQCINKLEAQSAYLLKDKKTNK